MPKQYYLEATVKASWHSRIELLNNLDADTIMLFLGEEKIPRKPSQIPMGAQVMIQDPRTTREVLVARNISRVRGRQGCWHVVL